MSEGKYNYARDGFVYLLSYATLLISSLGLNFLLKAIVNKFVPDALPNVGMMLNDEAVIGFMAAVLIAFPIFAYLNLVANRLLKVGKMKPDSGVRNWLLYITMVVVILIIIWQIIQLFMGLMNGTLVARFIIHTLITLAIAATVLGYQWWHLRHFSKESPRIGAGFRLFEWIVFIAAAGAVIGSFFIIGSPAERRAENLDASRVERLNGIQEAIQQYYGFKGEVGHQKLPVNLDQLITDVNIFVAPDGLIDPETKERFEYKVTGAKTYELCATFDTVLSKDSDESKIYREEISEPSSVVQRFYHGVGRECFALTVT
ncbi:hypothetical protein JXA59_00680 [Patescibacteria group bacterium]|nr:hypothetical protein [Patescibacteria group bacterium]